jgi:pilus assembly protein Flp/PilA
MMHLITRILSQASARADDRGATMVEYGLLVAFIALVALVGVTALGVRVDALFDRVTF